MTLDIEDFLARLQNFEKVRNQNLFKEYSLQPVQKIFHEFCNPENSPSLRVSVVGTNGKGSLSHFLVSLAQQVENWNPVGLYTSPHLFHFTERIRLNGQPIPIHYINKILNHLDQKKINLLNQLSYFEFLTLLSFMYFQESRSPFQVFEAGLGGRLDATKLNSPQFVVVTKIGLDHVEILGETEEKILIEKLGICTDNTRMLFTFRQKDSLIEIMEDFAKRRKIPFYIFDKEFSSNYLDYNFQFASFIMNTIFQDQYPNLKTPEWKKPKEKVSGRMEIISENPKILFDVAHNVDAIIHLLKSIENVYPGQKWNILYAGLKDKDILSILQNLQNWQNTRKIFQIINSPFCEESIEAVRKISDQEIKDVIPKEENLLICGSFRLYQYKNLFIPA